MMDMYLSSKFGIHSFCCFWENKLYGRTDGRRKQNPSTRDWSKLSCEQMGLANGHMITKSSWLPNKTEIFIFAISEL